jgi:hypothetical protein
MKKRTNVTTTLDAEMYKTMKLIATNLNKDANDIIEMGMRNIIQKYEKNKALSDEVFITQEELDSLSKKNRKTLENLKYFDGKYTVSVTEASQRLQLTRDKIYSKIKSKDLDAIMKKPNSGGKKRWFLNAAQINELSPKANANFNKTIKLSKNDLKTNGKFSILLELE